jgi:hypothetical protein
MTSATRSFLLPRFFGCSSHVGSGLRVRNRSTRQGGLRDNRLMHERWVYLDAKETVFERQLALLAAID